MTLLLPIIIRSQRVVGQRVFHGNAMVESAITK